ncbi:hypothetical protein SUGI_1182840 [Cryptomeria japonica]|nr:hypothetical protein SUGI_1182840 [Cryptomeria japonica]
MLEPSNSNSSMSVVTHRKNVAILISKSGNDSVEFSLMEYIVTDSYGNGYDGLQSASETISALSDLLIIDEAFKNSPIGNGGKGQIQRGDNVEVCANVETEGMMEPAKPLQYDCNRHEKSESESYFWALAHLTAGEDVTDFGSLVLETVGGLTYDLTYGDLLMIFAQHGLLAVFAQKGVMDCSNNRQSTTATIINEEEWLVAMELGFFTYLPVAINDVIELVALQIMANAGDGLQVSPAHIVSQIPNVTNPDASITLDMILRVLASHSLLSCSVSTYKNGKPKRLYGLTPLYKYLVQNKDGLSLAQLALMNQDKVFIDTWHYLKDAILEGSQPFTKVHGVNTFDYLAKEHTEEEFKDPSKAIVFAGGVKPICCVNGVWVIEFQK